jgi:hypothetical protein
MHLLLARKGYPSYTERTVSLNFYMKNASGEEEWRHDTNAVPICYVCFWHSKKGRWTKCSLILMWVFDAEGQNSRHLGRDLSRMMGRSFCSCTGLSHVFLSSVLRMPLSSFCHVPLICSVIIFHFHVTFATPFFFFYFCLSSLPTSPIFLTCICLTASLFRVTL